jgi:hypothetical protein
VVDLGRWVSGGRRTEAGPAFVDPGPDQSPENTLVGRVVSVGESLRRGVSDSKFESCRASRGS